MNKVEDLTKEKLNELYWENKRSIRSIADDYKCHKETIRDRMIKWDIPRRTVSQALLRNSIRNYPEDVNEEDKLGLLEDLAKIAPIKYKFKPRKNLWIPLPIEAFNSKAKDARLTLVISDLHLGDTDHLPETYWNCISNLLIILKTLHKKFIIPHVSIVFNGDIVSGRQVYRMQELRTLVPRGHWQTAIAEKVIKDTISKIEDVFKVKDVYMLKGTHEQLGENYVMYIKRTVPNSKYAGRSLVLNIADDLGKFNVLFTHGYGSSDYYPISYSLIRDLWKFVTQYKMQGIPIERACIGHYHRLMTNLDLESVILDCTGGFQRWEYTISQRPSGVLLYLYYNGEVSAIPIRPNPEVESNERNDSALEYKNMSYYSQKLLEHLKEIEKVGV